MCSVASFAMLCVASPFTRLQFEGGGEVTLVGVCAGVCCAYLPHDTQYRCAASTYQVHLHKVLCTKVWSLTFLHIRLLEFQYFDNMLLYHSFVVSPIFRRVPPHTEVVPPERVAAAAPYGSGIFCLHALHCVSLLPAVLAGSRISTHVRSRPSCQASRPSRELPPCVHLLYGGAPCFTWTVLNHVACLLPFGTCQRHIRYGKVGQRCSESGNLCTASRSYAPDAVHWLSACCCCKEPPVMPLIVFWVVVAKIEDVTQHVLRTSRPEPLFVQCHGERVQLRAMTDRSKSRSGSRTLPGGLPKLTRPMLRISGSRWSRDSADSGVVRSKVEGNCRDCLFAP